MKLPFSAFGLAFPLLLLNAIESNATQLYNSTSTNIGHESGRYHGNCSHSSNVLMPCWTASQSADDREGYIQYGPYVTNLSAGDNIAEFTLGASLGSGKLAVIEVYDYTGSRYLATKTLYNTDSPRAAALSSAWGSTTIFRDMPWSSRFTGSVSVA